MEIAAEISAHDYGRAIFGVLMIAVSGGILTLAKRQNYERYLQFRVPGAMACIFSCFLILATFTGGVRQASRRLAFRESIRELATSSHALKINGSPVSDSKAYTNELLLLQAKFARKSHATAKYEITIEASHETMKITLQQDSRRDDEFWTWVSHRESGDRRVGTIKSAKLRDLLIGEPKHKPNAPKL